MMTSFSGVWRAILLFTAGATFTLVHRLLVLQRQSKLGLKNYGIDALLAAGGWWLAPVVGTVAVALGLICPTLERRIGKWASGPPAPEWTKVLRCSAFFVGINHASAKVEYPSSLQLAVTLAALCATLWWCFDRSVSGLVAGVAVALASSVITHLYIHNLHSNETNSPDWQLWIPYVFFSGGVTMVNFGRHLAALSSTNPPVQLKVHND